MPVTAHQLAATAEKLNLNNELIVQNAAMSSSDGTAWFRIWKARSVSRRLAAVADMEPDSSRRDALAKRIAAMDTAHEGFSHESVVKRSS